jgi:hypothetical protein
MPTENGNGGNPGGNGEAAENKAGEGANATPDTTTAAGKETTATNSKVLTMTQEEFDERIEKRLKRDREKTAADAKLDKETRLEKENAELRQGQNLRDAKDGFIAKSGLDFAKGQRVFNMYKDEIEFSDKGKPENLDAVIKTAKAEWPELFGGKGAGGGNNRGKADAGAGNGGESGENAGSMNALIRNARK